MVEAFDLGHAHTSRNKRFHPTTFFMSIAHQTSSHAKRKAKTTKTTHRPAHFQKVHEK